MDTEFKPRRFGFIERISLKQWLTLLTIVLAIGGADYVHLLLQQIQCSQS